MPQAIAPRTAWRFFPYFIIAGLGLVVAVNIGMAVLAHRSAPGLAVQGSFATSNAYGRIQEESRRQVSLGWSLDVGLKDGRLRATATRPVGDGTTLALEMLEVEPGKFRSDIALPGQGQWDVLFVASSEGRNFRHTRRILVP